MGIKGLLNDNENKKKIFNLFFSVAAVAVFNLVIQFVLYPSFERQLGTEQYGVALTIISFVAITAGTCGYAVNCARLLNVQKGRCANGDYNLILLAAGFLSCVVGIAYILYLGVSTPIALLLYIVLVYTTLIRYYAEVEFRLSTNFFQYMIFYILISVGYIIGIFAFKASKQWMLGLIIGELLAFLYVLWRGSIFKAPHLKPTADFKPILFSCGFLFLSTLIDNIALHADRILLMAITKDGSAVTIYYIASLVGKVVAMLTVPLNSIIISYLVRYKGNLSKKLWLLMVGAVAIFGVVSFAGCMLVSPILIKILYPDSLEAVKPYIMSAVLGQIFYFLSGMLMMILLCFKGEKKQLLLNAIYAVIFFACVALGTIAGGLNGFVLAILIANAIRFVAAVIWGFFSKKDEQTSTVSAN